MFIGVGDEIVGEGAGFEARFVQLLLQHCCAMLDRRPNLSLRRAGRERADAGVGSEISRPSGMGISWLQVRLLNILQHHSAFVVR